MAKKKGTEKVTTLILGEENILTTKAVGEEVPMTTVAIGEEDKNLKEKERFTTLALGVTKPKGSSNLPFCAWRWT